MRHTLRVAKPVITLLAPSLESSIRAQEALKLLVSVEPQTVDVRPDDSLNSSFASSIPGFSFSWDSVASRCSHSGTMFHFLSIKKDSAWSGTKLGDKHGLFSLLSVTDNGSDGDDDKSNRHESVATEVSRAITDTRNLLSDHLSQSLLKIKTKALAGSPLISSDLLAHISNGGLPILRFPEQKVVASMDASHQPSTENSGLKEMVIPFYDFASYKDGSSLLSRLSNSNLGRVVPGIYRWYDSPICIRPLPSGPVDQTLGRPSFIFHCPQLEDIEQQQKQQGQFQGATVSRIGFGGLGSGQLMISHEALGGLDFRLCSKTDVSSAFHEAQDSLLAGSIDELQSTNTLLNGKEKAKDDHRIGDGDCWVEVRESVRRPTGFVRNIAAYYADKSPKIAKAPDLPYE